MRILSPDYRKWLCPPYRIYESIDEVPASIWSNAAFIVERLLVDPDAPSVTKLRWDFCLDEGIMTEATFSDLLCLPGSMIAVKTQPEPHAEAIALRARMGLDYGSIDYFLTPDGAVPMDVNKTVSVTQSWVDAHAFLRDHLDRAADALARFARGG